MSTPRSRSDGDLGRLLAEGLHRRADGPVDERRLVTGAQAGAARIRRRRRAMASAAALVVLLPAALLGAYRLVGEDSSGPDTAGSAAGRPFTEQGEEGSADGGVPALGSASPSSGDSAGGGGSGQATAAGVPSDAGAVPPGPTAAESPGAGPGPGAAPSSSGGAAAGSPSLPRTGTVAASTGPVPASALLAAADLTAVTGPGLVKLSDTTPAPAPTAADVCGSTPIGPPAAAASRSVVYQQVRSASSVWLAGSAVRVGPVGEALGYVAELGGQACLGAVAVSGAEVAFAGRGPADSEGRTHWFGVARTGGVIAEVRLAVPVGGEVTTSTVTGLLRTAVARLTSAGLVPR